MGLLPKLRGENGGEVMSEADYLDDGADYCDIYGGEDEPEECEDCRRWTCLECPYADI